MAPIRAVVMASPTRNATRLLNYVLTEKDGQRPGERFVAASGINGCIPEYADRQMRQNRRKHRKDATRTVQVRAGVDSDGNPVYNTITEGAYVQQYHVIESFAREGQGALDPDEPDAWEEAHRLGTELAMKLAGETRMAIVVTQIDGTTGCLHNHIVIDSIDKVSGKSLSSSVVKHSVLTATHDQMLAEQGYEQGNERLTAEEHVEKSEERGLLKHRQWEANGKQGPEPFAFAVLKERVRTALADPRCTSFEQYAEVALEHGVAVEQRGESGRGLTYTMVRDDGKGGELEPGPSSRRRASRLGRFAMMDAVEESIQRNVELAAQQQKPAGLTTAQMAALMQDALDDDLAELRAGSAAMMAADMAAARARRDQEAATLREATEQEPEPVEQTAEDRERELADRVILNEYDLFKWKVRAPDRYGMRKAGMADQEIDAAIRAWRELGEPRTAGERERDGEEVRAADEPQAEDAVEDEQVTSATADVTPPAPATAVAVESTSTSPERPGTVDEDQERGPETDEGRAADEPPPVIEVDPEDEQVTAATAAVTPPAPATAGAVETSSVPTSPERSGTPWRNGVLDHRPTRQREVPTWERMVELNATTHELLAKGEPITGEHTKGLRQATLEQYEDQGMDPAVTYELWRRFAKLAEARRAREVQQDVERSTAMRAEVELGDFSWPGEPPTLALLKVTATRKLDAREQLVVEQHAEEMAEVEAVETEKEGGD